MKKLNLIATAGFIAFVFAGCTGKVQTNPIPDDNKYNIPTKNFKQENKVSEDYIIDFNRYAKSVFKNTPYKKVDTAQAEQQPEEKIYNTNNESKLWNYGYQKAKQ